MFVKALFNYEPDSDDLMPCPQAGLAFAIGDILQILSKDDHSWWQAKVLNRAPKSGLVPSPELQEWRSAQLAVHNSKESASN